MSRHRTARTSCLMSRDGSRLEALSHALALGPGGQRNHTHDNNKPMRVGPGRSPLQPILQASPAAPPRHHVPHPVPSPETVKPSNVPRAAALLPAHKPTRSALTAPVRPGWPSPSPPNPRLPAAAAARRPPAPAGSRRSPARRCIFCASRSLSIGSAGGSPGSLSTRCVLASPACSSWAPSASTSAACALCRTWAPARPRGGARRPSASR
mmetsp:Transcript_38360/g.105824  ORF Transcript_38360/g.105824 Transcript_38360/m.105824 type:complete len:210 (-) Transcript_38360:5168-5797(-)